MELDTGNRRLWRRVPSHERCEWSPVNISFPCLFPANRRESSLAVRPAFVNRHPHVLCKGDTGSCLFIIRFFASLSTLFKASGNPGASLWFTCSSMAPDWSRHYKFALPLHTLLRPPSTMATTPLTSCQPQAICRVPDLPLGRRSRLKPNGRLRPMQSRPTTPISPS